MARPFKADKNRPFAAGTPEKPGSLSAREPLGWVRLIEEPAAAGLQAFKDRCVLWAYCLANRQGGRWSRRRWAHGHRYRLRNSRTHPRPRGDWVRGPDTSRGWLLGRDGGTGTFKRGPPDVALGYACGVSMGSSPNGTR